MKDLENAINVRNESRNGVVPIDRQGMRE